MDFVAFFTDNYPQIQFELKLTGKTWMNPFCAYVQFQTFWSLYNLIHDPFSALLIFFKKLFSLNGVALCMLKSNC